MFGVLTEQLRDEFLAAQRARSAAGHDPVAVAPAAVSGFVDVCAANPAFITVLEHLALTDPELRELWRGRGIRERLLKRMVRWVETLVAAGVAGPLAPPDMVATAASGMAVRFAPLIAARPADRDQIMGQLRCLYRQTLGIDRHDQSRPTEEPS